MEKSRRASCVVGVPVAVCVLGAFISTAHAQPVSPLVNDALMNTAPAPDAQGNAAPYVAPPPAVARQPVWFEARDRKTTYFVGVEGNTACQTPCSLGLPAGPHMVVVNGPGSRFFRRPVVIPDSPVLVKLQHITVGRIIAGSILSAVSLPLNFFGALVAFAENSPASLPLGVPMLLTGLGCTVTGIVLLATSRTNTALVRPLPGAALRFDGAGVGMTSDRRGAVAALTLSY